MWLLVRTQVVRQGFTHPVDHLACHRLAVFMPAGGVSGGGDWDDNTVGGGDGDPAGMTTAGIPPLQVGTQPWQPCMLRAIFRLASSVSCMLPGCQINFSLLTCLVDGVVSHTATRPAVHVLPGGCR